MAIDETEIERRFVYHVPTQNNRIVHDNVRRLTLSYAKMLTASLSGESREKSLALTALEEASFWAHAHIARNMQHE